MRGHPFAFRNRLSVARAPADADDGRMDTPERPAASADARPRRRSADAASPAARQPGRTPSGAGHARPRHLGRGVRQATAKRAEQGARAHHEERPDRVERSDSRRQPVQVLQHHRIRAEPHRGRLHAPGRRAGRPAGHLQPRPTCVRCSRPASSKTSSASPAGGCCKCIGPASPYPICSTTSGFKPRPRP